MKQPDRNDLLIAALWLENNEGEPDERNPMLRVAKWLLALAEDQMVKQVAKEHNIPMSLARKAVKLAEARS